MIVVSTRPKNEPHKSFLGENMTPKVLLLSATALAFCWPMQALAQGTTEGDAGTAEASATRQTVFEPDYFAGYNPDTALDMLEQVPGFTIDGGANLRGITGTEGNVLIDGAYPAGGGSVQSLLERIPASQVARIELLRGSADGVNFRGREVLANVVRKDLGSSWLVTRGEVALIDHEIGGTASLDLGYNRGGTTAQLAASAYDYSGNHGRAGTTVFSPAGATVQTEDQQTDYITRGADFSANLDWQSGDVRVALYSTYTTTKDRSEILTDVTGTGGGDFTWSYLYDGGSEYADGGVEVEFPISASLNGQLNASHNRSISTSDDDYSDPFFNGQSSSYFRIIESNVRGLLTRKFSDRLTVNLSAEGSFNRALQDYELIADGFLVDLPLAQANIAEDRGLALATITWRPIAGLTIDGGAGLDFSEVTVRFDEADNRQDFTYFKPQLAASYNPDDDTTLRLAGRREVDQLGLANFVASAALDTQLINAGDARVAPERSWLVEASAERRFGDKGSIKLELIHEWIANAIDNLVLPGGFNALGNIGAAELTELKGTLALPLDGLGLSNSLLRSEASLFWSEVTDPITGERRRISDQQRLVTDISFTQDFPRSGLGWGFSLSPGSASRDYRVSEFVTDRDGESLRVYGSYKPVSDITIQLTGQIGYRSSREEREYYSGDRSSGMLDRLEVEQTGTSNTIALSLRKAW